MPSSRLPFFSYQAVVLLSEDWPLGIEGGSLLQPAFLDSRALLTQHHQCSVFTSLSGSTLLRDPVVLSGKDSGWKIF